MKKILAFCVLIISGCQSIQPPKEFVYKEINTHQFKLASWQKITDNNADYRIYILRGTVMLLMQTDNQAGIRHPTESWYVN